MPLPYVAIPYVPLPIGCLCQHTTGTSAHIVTTKYWHRQHFLRALRAKAWRVVVVGRECMVLLHRCRIIHHHAILATTDYLVFVSFPQYGMNKAMAEWEVNNSTDPKTGRGNSNLVSLAGCFRGSLIVQKLYLHVFGVLILLIAIPPHHPRPRPRPRPLASAQVC